MVTTSPRPKKSEKKVKPLPSYYDGTASHWPRDIGEAYTRDCGPYTIQNAETLIEEEPLEIYNGWLVWQEMTDAEERRVAANIQVILDFAARLAKFGQAYPDQFECVMQNGDTFKPDICLISSQRYENSVEPSKEGGTHLVLKGGPELVVEMHSPSNRRTKERLKRQSYFENGTLVVWDVDPKKHKIRVYEAANPEEARELVGKDEISCEQILPGWRRKVADFFSKDLSAEQIAGQAAEDWRKDERIKVLQETLLRLAGKRFSDEPLPINFQEQLNRYNLQQLNDLLDNLAISANLQEWLATLAE